MRYSLKNTCSFYGTASLPEINHDTPRPHVPSDPHPTDSQSAAVDSKSKQSSDAASTYVARQCLFGTTMLIWQDNAYLARQCLFGKTMLIWHDNAYLARQCLFGTKMDEWLSISYPAGLSNVACQNTRSSPSYTAHAVDQVIAARMHPTPN